MEKQKNKDRYLFVKNRYYPGKLLHAGDFVREQEYGNAKLEFLNRKFHGWGIIQGLEVRPGEGSTLRIAAGSAIDRRGRIIVMPEDVVADPEKLEGLKKEAVHDFVLGIQYDERPVDRERSLLSEKETVEVARIAESYVLKAYTVGEWEQMKGSEEAALTEERILYEDGEVRLSLRIPKVVPTDSIFRVCIQATALVGGNVSIGWRCTAKLQGAFFLGSGRSLQIMEEQQTVMSGSLYQEWQICTEEYRKQTIAMELSRLEIFRQGRRPVEAEACQVYIDTAFVYEDAVRERLHRKEEGSGGEDWVPLARIRHGGAGQSGIYVLADEPGLRRRVVQSEETEFIRRGAEENGIIDIRWRGLLKRLQPRSYPADQEQSDRPSRPVRPAEMPKPPPERVPERLLPGRREQIHRGVAVIQIPRRYRKGDTLFSEEISHGFPGEEVFLWVERMYEEPSYAYWEKNSTRHTAVHGADDLFADGWYSGWEIQRQALRQEIEAGTFQIAMILSKGRRRRRSREVAMAWTAVRLTGAAETARSTGQTRQMESVRSPAQTPPEK